MHVAWAGEFQVENPVWPAKSVRPAVRGRRGRTSQLSWGRLSQSRRSLWSAGNPSGLARGSPVWSPSPPRWPTPWWASPSWAGLSAQSRLIPMSWLINFSMRLSSRLHKSQSHQLGPFSISGLVSSTSRTLKGKHEIRNFNRTGSEFYSSFSLNLRTINIVILATIPIPIQNFGLFL